VLAGPSPWPWREIWTEPREVLRRVRHLPLLAAAAAAVVAGGLSGVVALARETWPVFGGAPLSFGVPLLSWLMAALQGALLGVMSAFGLGWLLTRLGRLLGGGGSYASVVHALAWPLLATVQAQLLLFAVGLVGRTPFGDVFPGVVSSALSVLSVGLWVWLAWVYVAALSEAHGYPSRRALLTFVSAFALLGLLAAGLGGVLYVVVG
jgi:hypothetical protein